MAQKFATKKSSYGGGLNRHSEPNTMAHQQYQKRLCRGHLKYQGNSWANFVSLKFSQMLLDQFAKFRFLDNPLFFQIYLNKLKKKQRTFIFSNC